MLCADTLFHPSSPSGGRVGVSGRTGGAHERHSSAQSRRRPVLTACALWPLFGDTGLVLALPNPRPRARLRLPSLPPGAGAGTSWPESPPQTSVRAHNAEPAGARPGLGGEPDPGPCSGVPVRTTGHSCGSRLTRPPAIPSIAPQNPPLPAGDKLWGSCRPHPGCHRLRSPAFSFLRTRLPPQKPWVPFPGQGKGAQEAGAGGNAGGRPRQDAREGPGVLGCGGGKRGVPRAGAGTRDSGSGPSGHLVGRNLHPAPAFGPR